VLREHGRDLAAARRQYRAYARACLTEDDTPMREAMAASRYAIGGAEFIERTEAGIEQRRSGCLQDRDLDLPRWTVPPEEIDAAVAKHYDVDPTMLSAHGHRAGLAKAVAVELGARLAGMSGRAIGVHRGITGTAVAAIHQRLAGRPDVLEGVESLARQLRRTGEKCKVSV
jgi:hypothetical protein